jgi:hypothetical protein
MKHFLILLFLGGTTGLLSAQVSVPANGQISGDAERYYLLKAGKGQYFDPFLMQTLVNNDLDTNQIVQFKNELYDFIDHITKRFDKQTQAHSLLKAVYYKVHRKYLLDYTAFTNFGSLVEKGEYDCLTGTILYTWIISQIGYENTVVETKYHTYLMIQTDDGDFMYESTDALNGFIYEKAEIAERLSDIREEESKNDLFSLDEEPVDFINLIGLQYYNAAVHAYNKQMFCEAVDQLEKGNIFYRGKRMKEFGIVLARGIVSSEMEPDKKTSYLMKLTQILNNGWVTANIN